MRRLNQRALYLGICGVMLLCVPIGRSVLYIIDERELAVVLQFGKPVAERTEPGLYFKLPLIQEVRRLPKTYQFWEGSAPTEKLVDVTTSDSKKIEATIWAVWRVTDPDSFVKTLQTTTLAETRVKEFVRSTARDVMTRNDLAEIVRSTNRRMSLTPGLPESALQGEDQEVMEEAVEEAIKSAMSPEAQQRVVQGRKKLIEQIRQDAQGALGEVSESESTDDGRGIVLVDVGLSRVDFVPEVRDAAFERLIALMDAIATENQSEGKQRKQEIINQATSDAEAIRGEGTEQANILRGEVEASIIDSFAAAIEESGDFYEFNRTLELYKKALSGGDTRLILSTSNPLFELLSDYDAGRKPSTNSPPSGLPTLPDPLWESEELTESSGTASPDPIALEPSRE